MSSYLSNSNDLLTNDFRRSHILVFSHQISYTKYTHRLIKFKKLIFWKVLDKYGLQILKVSSSLITLLDFVVDTPWIYPESKNFLSIDDMDEFSYHIDADSSALKNEFTVIKAMLQSKTINDVIDFLNELLPLSNTFTQTLQMVKDAIMMPISQVTCERSFSKMKITKNYVRNSMTNKRLSDLTVLAVERDFNMNYERITDKFSRNHKNCRILLC